jgi:hypothetical protein
LSREESLAAVIEELVDEIQSLNPSMPVEKNPRVEIARHVLAGGTLEFQLVVAGTLMKRDIPLSRTDPADLQGLPDVPKAEEEKPNKAATEALQQFNQLRGVSDRARATYELLMENKGKAVKNSTIVKRLKELDLLGGRVKGTDAEANLVYRIMKELREAGVGINSQPRKPGFTLPE